MLSTQKMRDAADRARNQALTEDPNDQISALNLAIEAALQEDRLQDRNPQHGMLQWLAQDLSLFDGRLLEWAVHEHLDNGVSITCIRCIIVERVLAAGQIKGGH